MRGRDGEALVDPPICGRCRGERRLRRVAVGARQAAGSELHAAEPAGDDDGGVMEAGRNDRLEDRPSRGPRGLAGIRAPREIFLHETEGPAVVRGVEVLLRDRRQARLELLGRRDGKRRRRKPRALDAQLRARLAREYPVAIVFRRHGRKISNPEAVFTTAVPMRRALFLLILALAATAEAATVEWRSDGRIRELRGGLAFDAGPEAAKSLVEALGALVRDPADGTTVREISRRASLTGTHVRFAQFLGEERILGAEIVLRYDERGDLAAISNRLAVHRAGIAGAMTDARVPPELEARATRRERILFAENGVVRRAARLVVPDRFGELAYDVDPATGEVIRITPDYWLDRSARAFEANPVTILNDPALRDGDDSGAAVPPEAYADVVLRDLGPGPGLTGPRVEVVDLESPKTGPADPEGSLLFDRAADGFEEVMAYYHIDRALGYIESLGYASERAMFTRAVRADAHAVNGADQSFYRWGAGGQAALLFGDGGVDDAEDPDIVLHELGHAIQDAIAPFAFSGSFGSEARAMGEGFGDYWAFSAGWASSVGAGRDPFCIGDWDARCGGTLSCGYDEGADCLRRVDSAKTMEDFVRLEQSGVEHGNGEIWSSALREVFLAAVAHEGAEAGRRTVDTLVLESHYGVPPTPSFRTMGRRMLEVDRILFGGANRAAVCAAMSSRGIFGAGDCDIVPRGGATLFQAADFALAIPDANAAGIRSTLWIDDARPIGEVRVPVRVRHPFRGELRIELTAPSGRTFVLKETSADSGADIDTVYGLDVDPVEPLTPLVGTPARGAWTLAVADTRTADEGVLLSWGIEIRFEGDEPLAARGAAGGPTLHLSAVAHTPGAAETFFVSDARILNPTAASRHVTVFFTPSGTDGATTFAARELSIAPGQQIALDDLVAAEFRSAGTGSLEVRGDVEGLVLTSRTYNDDAAGTYGQFVPGVSAARALRAGDPSHHILALRNDAAFRSNLGFAEVAGGTGMVAWTLFDGDGRAIEEGSAPIGPWSHAQVPVLGGYGGPAHRVARAEVRVVSGTARVVAYGSLVDNLTGDGAFVPAWPPLGAGRADVPAIIRAAGGFGTTWRSDLWIANLSDAEATFALRWTAPGGAVRTAAIELAAGTSAAIEDLIASLFGEDAGVGALRIETGAGAWAASSRVWTGGSSGTFGQHVPVAGAADAVGAGEGALAIAQLAHGGAFRTNIGVAETAGTAAAVRIRLRDAAGRDVWETHIDVPAGEQRQIMLALAGAPAVANGYALVDVLGGSGRVVAYGSVIDNRSSDPVYVPGIPLQ